MIMSAEAPHIVCTGCEAVNRVPAGKNASAAKCGRCHRPLFSGKPASAATKSFAKQIRANDIPVLVDFWADWCGPCKAMAPIFEEAAVNFEPRIRFLKVDTEAEPALAAQYNIRSIPTLMLFRKGAIVAQRAGTTDAQGLRSWLRQHAFNDSLV
jgi:thioredoxin 2